MKFRLLLLFSGILLGMLAVTTYASLDRSVLNVGTELLTDPWFQATLVDAYFGFITFYLWVFYKEPHAVGRFAWFLLIMLLGNIAMSVYLLIQIVKWNESEGVGSLLLRKDASRVSTDGA